MLMRKTVMGLASVAVVAMASVGAAQTKPMAPGSSESHEHGAGQAAESSHMPMMTPEMMATMCARMGHQMEHRMMGMGMGPGMMGMGMGPGMMGASDPKAQARMLRFRADLMKAMSDVMLKHAAELEKAK